MITPTKRLSGSKSLIFVGAQILDLVDEPKTVSRLWDEIKRNRQKRFGDELITYSWFVLALDLLYALGAIELQFGLIQRRTDDSQNLQHSA